MLQPEALGRPVAASPQTRPDPAQAFRVAEVGRPDPMALDTLIPSLVQTRAVPPALAPPEDDATDRLAALFRLGG